MGGYGRSAVVLLAGVSFVGCGLEEISVVQIEDVVVAEVYAQAQMAESGQSVVPPNALWAFLHRTVDRVGTPRGVEGAEVLVTIPGVGEVRLGEQNATRCLQADTAFAVGTCYAASSEDAARLTPGQALSVRIVLPGGELMEGATRIPGAFSIPGLGAACFLEPDRQMRIQWSPSDGAWAYIAETAIRGLPEALEEEGIESEDPLYLLGLAISGEDTDIRFPAEFGVFDRFDLNRDLAIRLQTGLPLGARADVTIAATDRNYVNWVRGGNFNPSGQVRVPSIRGAGTGVFASTLVRRFGVLVDDLAAGAAARCPGS